MDSQQPFASPDFTTAQPMQSESVPPPPPAPSMAHRIFFGRFGFRAGYGIAIYAISWILLNIVGGIVAVASIGMLKALIAARMYDQAHPGQPHQHVTIPFMPGLAGVNDAILFFGMLALAWLLARAERRHFGWFGIGANRIKDFLPGAFWGLAALSGLVFTLHSLHLLYFDSRLLFGIPMLVYGLKWLVAFLFVGFAEEYFLRGYMQYTLSRGVFGLAEKMSPAHARATAFWIAAFVLSVFFACLHLGNGGENFLGLLQVFLVGMVFAYVLFRTGSLWWAIGFHMSWDWAQSFLYGVPDSGNLSVGRLFQTHYAGKTLLSGGSDGPEGSLLCVCIFLIMIFIIRFTTKRGELPPLEQLPRE